jgi:DNA-binding response OmpR family regulator
MHDRPRTVLLSIGDPVFRLDVASAFIEAGYHVVDAGRPSIVGQRVSLAVIDADPPQPETYPLIRRLRRGKTPLVVLTSNRSRRPDPAGLMRVSKPLASDVMVAHVTLGLLGISEAGTAGKEPVRLPAAR